MRALLILALTACTLDVSAKPECLVDTDCYYPQRGHCVEQVCERNVGPTGNPDVIYVMDTGKIVAEVLSNDYDLEGDPIRIESIRRNDPSTGNIGPSGSTAVQIDVTDVPSTYAYLVRDTYDVNEQWIPITVAYLPAAVTIPVEAGATVSLANVLGAIVDPTQVELLTAPAVGTLTGTLPNVTYAPPATYCGADAATYRVTGANGTFDVAITFEVGIILNGEHREIELGEPTTIDVLANERSGLELVSTNHATATISSGKDTLIVNPPTTAAGSYAIQYTAKDARGCVGTATLDLDVSFPTRVVVGEGLTGDAFDAVLSGDGRVVAFTSADATLVSGDTNANADVFVRDLVTNSVERISVTSTGSQANEGSSSPSISADGRWVTFVSRANNLDAADTTSVEDVYLHDRTTGATTLVSISIDGTGSDQASVTPHLSSDGARIVFASSATRLVASDTNAVLDIFVRDVGTATTTRVSLTSSAAQVPFASQTRPRISGNGRYVALSSSSSLDGSGQGGAFLVDTTGQAITRIHSSSGELDLDDAGRFIVHASFNVTLLDRVVENTTIIGSAISAGFPSMSADGEYVAVAHGKQVEARGTGALVNCIVDAAGTVVAATPLRRAEISGDGRWIVFSTSEWPGYLGRFVIVRVWNRAYAN